MIYPPIFHHSPSVDRITPLRSRAALTYAEAQSRIDDTRLSDELSLDLRRLNAIARILRRRRAEAGALQLASPEVKFEIDTETHDPLDVGMYQATPLHWRFPTTSS